MLSPTYTAQQVAESLGVSVWFVQEQVRRGRVTCLRVGGASNAPMRFEETHVAELKRLMTPVVVEPKRRRRRRVA